MAEETTRELPTHVDEDGVLTATTLTSPVDNKVRGECTVPPSTVLPVVFVPGIMGSNLKAKEKIITDDGIIPKGAKTWNVSSKTSPLGMWGKSPAYRQAVFNHEAVMVDNQGAITPGESPIGNLVFTWATGQGSSSGISERKRDVAAGVR